LIRGWRRDDAPISPDAVPSVIAIEECSTLSTGQGGSAAQMKDLTDHLAANSRQSEVAEAQCADALTSRRDLALAAGWSRRRHLLALVATTNGGLSTPATRDNIPSCRCQARFRAGLW
jgi:hypothetical protein